MVRKRPRSAAMREALVEGRFFRKTTKVIGRDWGRFIASIDRRLGIIARKFIYSSSPIIHGKIIFITFQGEYTCNQKYITEELLKRNSDCEIVWALRQSAMKTAQFDLDYIPSRVRCVEQYTESFFEELATSEIWIANSVDFLKREIPKKDEQVFIETWHGSLGIKRFDASVNKGKAWVKAAELCANYADVLISNSLFEDDVYRTSYWPSTMIFHYGHPRNDVFFGWHSTAIRKIRSNILQEYGLDEDTQFALYAPTFRDDHQFECYSLDSGKIERALSEKFGGKWAVLTKYHPTVWKYMKTRARDGLGIDVTSYPDIQELMLVSDVAITDYSSWIYDFMLSGKPCFIFASDLDHYCSEERGFYYPLESTPFPIARNNEEMIQGIESFDKDSYAEKLEAFLQDKGCFEDGHASERVADLIEDIVERGKEAALNKAARYSKAAS